MDTEPVQTLRRCLRLVTQRVSALERAYVHRGRPLGEARMLYEIGPDGSEVRALREKLDLDGAYVSRLLRSLERQGLVQMSSGSDDGRARRASLTPNGHVEFRECEQSADALAESILAPLSVTKRQRLVAAMSECERLIRAGTADIRIEQPGSRDARWCLDAYFNELAARFETGFDVSTTDAARDDELTYPTGYFLVARLDGRPVGCGALKVKTAGVGEIRVKAAAVGEIKRMWTAPSVRGLGVARRILQALETKAGEIGIKALRLETNKALNEAQALYRANGYREVEPFNAEPYAHHWFEKLL